MPTAANPQPYPNPGWQNPGWQNPGWQNPGWQNQNPGWSGPWNHQGWSSPPFWQARGLGRPIAIAALVFLLAAGHIGRMLFWPIGLAALVFMVASGRMGCGRRRWNQTNWGQPQGPGVQESQAQNSSPQNSSLQNSSPWSCIPPWARWGGNGGGNGDKPPTSGNHAFDEYRAETLRRLEEEQSEFSSFLERLRFAKDKAEFDQFMAQRRQAPRPPAVPDEPSHG